MGLKLQLQGPADAVDIRVFSRALVLVAEASGAGGEAGWITSGLFLPPDLAKGVYFVQVRARKSGAYGAGRVLKVMVLD
jgi:hypothetical protein